MLLRHNGFDPALRRRLQITTPCDPPYVQRNGKRLINFASNDYLGLSSHPALIEASIRATKQYGTGSCASRLITGTLPLHHEVEEKIATLTKRESALLFNSGFQANTTILPALTNRHNTIYLDRRCHASLVQGAKLSGAHLRRYHALSDIQPKQGEWIVTESLFSTNGELTDLNHLTSLARQTGAHLLVDDAHAFGVLGLNGGGLCADYPEIDIVVGTFGKAAGCSGAYVALSHSLRDLLINTCTGFIYTTALPPPTLGAVNEALNQIPHSPRHQLTEMAHKIRPNSTHIIPLIAHTPKKALDLSAHLEDHGILALPFRPPSVPQGQSLVRIGLTLNHTDTHIDQLIEAHKQWQS